MNRSPIWRLAAGQGLLYRCWDGECLLYNDLSGDTHLLDEFAISLLEELRAAPQSATQLEENLFEPDSGSRVSVPGADAHGPLNVLPASDDDLSPSPETELIATVLADLAALQLVDTAAC